MYILPLPQDLPLSWPWDTPKQTTLDKDKDKEPVSGKPKPTRGRGRGRGRGGKSSGEVETKSDAPSTIDAAAQPTRKRFPYLLANLVRTGNQMQNAGSGAMLRKQALALITKRLTVHPIGRKPTNAEEQLVWNRHLLTMLGKLPAEHDATREKPTAINKTAEELLLSLDCKTVKL